MYGVNRLKTHVGMLVGGELRESEKAFTLVELLLVVAILGTLGAIGVPVYNNYIDRARNSAATAGVLEIESGIARFQAERGRPPNDLAEAGLPTRLDPWGNPYMYTRLQGLSKHDMDAKCRWDKLDKPLNEDFDLYSMGKDGKTQPKITNKDSHDDIIRAHEGAYVGLACEY